MSYVYICSYEKSRCYPAYLPVIGSWVPRIAGYQPQQTWMPCHCLRLPEAPKLAVTNKKGKAVFRFVHFVGTDRV